MHTTTRCPRGVGATPSCSHHASPHMHPGTGGARPTSAMPIAGALKKVVWQQPINDTVSEWLRRWTRNPLGSARKGSNPFGVDRRLGRGVWVQMYVVCALCIGLTVPEVAVGMVDEGAHALEVHCFLQSRQTPVGGCHTSCTSWTSSHRAAHFVTNAPPEWRSRR